VLHAVAVVGFRTAVQESLNLADFQSSQTVRILIKSKELQKAPEPARVHGDRAHYQSADTATHREPGPLFHATNTHSLRHKSSSFN
jgi:hypothetical protein